MAIEIDGVTTTPSGAIVITANNGEDEAVIQWVSRQDGKIGWMISSISVDDKPYILIPPTVGSENKMWASIGLALKKWMRQGIKPTFDVETEWLKVKKQMHEIMGF